MHQRPPTSPLFPYTTLFRSSKADILKALNRPDEAKTAWNQALEKATAPQLYTYGRQLQNQKKGAEAMEIFKRSEEHTSELQSLAYLVCRLLLEKKNKKNNHT